MAVKATKPKGKVAAPVAGADDLQVLHPELQATIAGREITVREYGFVEGMRLRPLLQPFLDDLHAIVAGGSLPPLEHITTLLGTHIDAVIEAVATAADLEVEWLTTPARTQDEGQHLLMLWWAANGPFYVRSVFSRIAADHAVSRHAGATSTPSSSTPDMEPSTPSGE